LLKKHLKTGSNLTFLTVRMEKPNTARVLRNKKNQVVKVVEQKNLQSWQKKSKEVNCGVYCFSLDFLKKYLPQVKKDSLSQEYYITKLIELGINNKEKVNTFQMDKEAYFQGVNTKKQLLKADKKMKQKLAVK